MTFQITTPLSSSVLATQTIGDNSVMETQSSTNHVRNDADFLGWFSQKMMLIEP